MAPIREGPLGRAMAWWADRVRRRAVPVTAAAGLATAAFLYAAATGLEVDTDTTHMLSERLPWRQTYEEYKEAFPRHVDQLLVVIRGASPDIADRARERLAARLRGEDVIMDVHLPGGGPFFDRHALLYMEPEELRELADNLAAFGPWLRRVEADPTLPEFFAAVERLLADGARGEAGIDPAPLLGALARAFRAQTGGEAFHLSWQELLRGERAASDERRSFLILQPRMDFGSLFPAGEAVDRVREAVRELGLDRQEEVEVRLTGQAAMEHEELHSVMRGGLVVAALALAMVGCILWVGLRSVHLLVACLATLVAGLAATAGFATAAVGRLNLISVAFAVLYIGLGIDYAIHLVLRYREGRSGGVSPGASLRGAAADVGPSIGLSAVTTAACFYAFVPTYFQGVSELGLISGTGMLIGFLVTLTLLPALLSLRPGGGIGGEATRTERLAAGVERLASRLSSALAARPRWVLAAAAVVGGVALLLAPRARFDANPVNLRDPDQESVAAYLELLRDTTAAPLTIAVVEPDLAAARRTAERLAALEVVEATLTIEDFVPERQTEKREVIDRIAAILGPPPAAAADGEGPPARTVSPGTEPAAALPGPGGATLESRLDAVRRFRESLARYRIAAGEEGAALARYLGFQIREWENRLEPWPPEGRARMAAALEESLLESLPRGMGRLRAALDPDPVRLEDLPPDLVERWVSPGGVRIEVLPAENVADTDALRRFVEGVRQVAPHATDTPVLQVAAGEEVVRAFRWAVLAALAVTTALLLLVLRSARDTALVLLPLLLAGVLTGAASVLLDMPFNFANVIALPLLLGVGVDNGIHMVHRARAAPPPDGDLLGTSTARAVVLSSLTTIASFGNLAFSPHPGMASMGSLLTVGMLAVLVCTLTVLPALLRPRLAGTPP